MQDILTDPHVTGNWDVTVAVTGPVAPPSTAIVQFCSNDANFPDNVVDVACKGVHLYLSKTRLLTRK